MKDPVAFVERHGVVVASGHGPVPSVAEAVAGEPIRGSWWAHPRGKAIFQALSAIGDSPSVAALKLVEGKVTFVHRRLWPALVAAATVLGKKRLARVEQVHTKTGAHRNVITPFPRWVPAAERERGKRLDPGKALAMLGDWTANRRG